MIELRISPAGYPMAPSVEEWEALSPAERAEVIAALPGEVTYNEMAPPEGDYHTWPKLRAYNALSNYFERAQRRACVMVEMPTYYPAEPRFAPDVLVVFDAETRLRDKWVVSAEGKGYDWVLELHGALR